jgi:hypothetical protein
MLKIPVRMFLMAMIMAWTAAPAGAQTFEVLGTRAAGMGGAFVAVADDATAVYWNPAGLALGGSYFSLVIDASQGRAEPDDPTHAGRRSSNLVALSALPLGISYYRLGVTSLVADAPGAPTVHLQRLITHHAGVTFVQSVAGQIVVATTLKLVRGVSARGVVPDGDRDDLLDEAGDLPEQGDNEFDADIGVMVSFGPLRTGLTVRNTREPDFLTPSGETIELERQTRAGLAYLGVRGLIVSADFDLERAEGLLGEVRNIATGAEAHLFRRVFVRSGFRFNTLSDQPGGRASVYSLGTSIVTFRSLVIDGQVTLGSEADRSWGVSARLVY